MPDPVADPRSCESCPVPCMYCDGGSLRAEQRSMVEVVPVGALVADRAVDADPCARCRSACTYCDGI